MKNFILRESLAFDGATAEGLLHFLGTRFIATYERPRALRLAAREIAFDAATVPAGGGFGPSEVLFARVGREITVATLELRRDGANATIVDHHCGRVGLRLMKTTGSSFTSFVRDNYTTLPDRRDRPLYIFMDVGWRYGEATDALGVDPARYVAGEQVSDVLRTVFHQFVSESIQHLLHEMGTRVLARFPTLAAVDFRAENRTRDPVVESPGDPLTKVYTDPFPAFGRITLRMSRAAG
jgi:urate oxidase